MFYTQHDTLKKCTRLLLLTLAVLLYVTCASAQNRVVRGKIMNAQQEALASASVNLLSASNSVVSFAISDKKGAFSIPVADTIDMPLWLEVNYLGYKKQRQPIKESILTYNIQLETDTAFLQSVTVKNRPYIEQLGDTLRYLVNNFARAEDRSIGDVLKRLPGIDVADDGSIYFNGKKIENLYIQGDDLMSGRYGLATKTIKKEMISGIDIIKNHQPIQVLKDKIFSDQTAINLILKDENSTKISTEAIAGAGLPEQFDVTINQILLNKKIKMVNSVGGNNSGIDYRADFKKIGNSNFVKEIEHEAANIDLSTGTVGPPDLPLINYYLNRSAVANLNGLYNTPRGLQLKVNIQSSTDRNTLAYNSYMESYLNNDTIYYNERQDYVNKPWQVNMTFNVMANKKKYFFNNNTQVSLSNNSSISQSDFGNTSFGQVLQKRLNEFSNDMNWTPALKGKGVVEFRWLISRTHNKQSLDIGSGYHSVISGQEGYFDHTIQDLKLPTLFSHAYFSYRLPGELIHQEYKVGYITEHQTLSSALTFTDNGETVAYHGDGGNNLGWKKDNVYFAPDYQLKYKRWRAGLQLPVSVQSVRYSQDLYGLDARQKDLLFNPGVSLRYDITPEQYLTAGFRYANVFGNISNIYRGSILENYRTLQANDAGLQQRNTSTYTFNYDFQESITMLFVNLGIAYDKVNANTISATEITDNIQKNILLPYPNARKSITVNAHFSKYVFSLSSTFSMKARVKRTDYQQLINNELYPLKGYEIYAAGNVSKKFNALEISYQPAATWYKSYSDEKNMISISNTAFQLNQSIVFRASFPKNYFVDLTGKHRYVWQTGNVSNKYFFADFGMMKKNIFRQADISLTVTNLFNVKDYTLYSLSANQLYSSRYMIRGRMGILRMSFYF